MITRKISLPIFAALAFSLSSSFLHAQTDTAPAAPVPPDSTVSTPPAPTTQAPPPAPAKPARAGSRPSTYTVKAGDTLWDLSHKFNTSITKLKKLNHLKSTHLKPGQVLKIPSATTTPTKTTSTHHAKTDKAVAFHSHSAQPVQDFDIPASTFASCPVPIPNDVDEPVTPSVTTSSPAPRVAPVAKPVALASSSGTSTVPKPKPLRATASPAPSPSLTWAQPVPPARPAHRGFFSFFDSSPPPVDWSARFTEAARQLGDRGLDYDDDWRPPGEARAWSMDCSNTTRYLYKVAAGISLPRTASDQYYYLHLQNKAWDVPQTASGFADCDYLRQNLKAGDLLFWENTYRPERQPPITHVMLFLGTNARGQWIMAGSQQSRGGEYNRSHGGPDIYVFNPTKPCGGYTTWLGLVHHQGRFCAFGRPLEADAAKLAVAAND